MSLYHCSPVTLGAGSIIMPGNWGRLTKAEQINAQGGFSAKLFRETMFELVRIREFPNCVSRLQAVFAFENLEHTHQFATQQMCVPYEIELVDPAAHLSRHPFEAVTFAQPGASGYAMTEALARQYWSATPMEKPEILTLSPLRIIRQL